MNHPIRALALLSAALLFSGCPKNGETRPEPVEDPSYRDAGQSTPPPSAVSGATPVNAPESAPESAPQAETEAQDANRATMENCVDRWLEARKMDMYGHPEGTMYAGGTPLFNEATGESTDRLEYIFKRHPEARQACAGQDAQ